MVAILPPHNIHRNIPHEKRRSVGSQAAEGLLTGVLGGISAGLQSGFSQYFEKQKEKKETDIITKYLEEVEKKNGRITPEDYAKAANTLPVSHSNKQLLLSSGALARTTQQLQQKEKQEQQDRNALESEAVSKYLSSPDIMKKSAPEIRKDLSSLGIRGPALNQVMSDINHEKMEGSHFKGDLVKNLDDTVRQLHKQYNDINTDPDEKPQIMQKIQELQREKSNLNQGGWVDLYRSQKSASGNSPNPTPLQAGVNQGIQAARNPQQPRQPMAPPSNFPSPQQRQPSDGGIPSLDDLLS